MAVILPGKFLYLANPRTASTSTRIALGKLPEAKMLWPQHQLLHECHLYADEQPVTAVRNPYDVLATWFQLQVKYKDFVEFLRKFEHKQFLLGDPPDLFWQCGEGFHILRWETLQKDLDEFLAGWGLPSVEIPRENTTKDKKPWQEYYTPEAFEAANERFGAILDRYGYERVDPSMESQK